MTDDSRIVKDRLPCWELNPRSPKFCASLANGRKRCPKGRCFAVDTEPSEEPS